MSKRLMDTVIVKSVERKSISVNGNPSYWVKFEPKYSLSEMKSNKGYTASDASCGYTATNFVGKDCKLEYHFTRNGALIIDTMKEVY